MAVFDRIPQADIDRRFTHFGRFLGLVPVYLAPDPLDADSVLLEVQNWWPEWSLDVALELFGFFCLISLFFAPGVEFRFPIVITGRVDGKPMQPNGGTE